MQGYRSLLGTPGVPAALLCKLTSRLPSAGQGLAIVALTAQATGSYAAAGLTAACAGAGLLACGPLLAQLSQRPGVAGRRWIVRCAIAAAASYTLMLVLALTGAPAALFAIAGALIGACSPPLGALLRTFVLDRAAGQAQLAHAWESATNGALWVGGPLLVAAFVAMSAIQWLFAAYAVMVLCGAALWLRLQRQYQPAGPAERQRPGRPPLRALAAPLLYAMTLIAAYDIVLLAFAALAEERGQRGWAGVWVACLSAGSLLGALIYGHVGRPARRLRAEQMICCALVAAQACAAALPSLLIVPLALLSGAASGVVFLLLSVWVDTQVHREQRSWAFQMVQSAQVLGGMIGAMSAGWASHLGGPSAALTLQASLIAVCCVIAIRAPRKAENLNAV